MGSRAAKQRLPQHEHFECRSIVEHVEYQSECQCLRGTPSVEHVVEKQSAERLRHPLTRCRASQPVRFISRSTSLDRVRLYINTLVGSLDLRYAYARCVYAGCIRAASTDDVASVPWIMRGYVRAMRAAVWQDCGC